MLTRSWFTVFSFPGRNRCKLVSPLTLGLGLQAPIKTEPSLVLYNDGVHLYQEPGHPWPGLEKQFEWLRYQDYAPHVCRCPDPRYPNVGIKHKGHDFQQVVRVHVCKGFFQTYQVALAPGDAMFFIEFPNTDAFFIRRIWRTRQVLMVI